MWWRRLLCYLYDQATFAKETVKIQLFFIKTLANQESNVSLPAYIFVECEVEFLVKCICDSTGIYVHMCLYNYVFIYGLFKPMCTYIYVCVCVCVRVCVYIYLYIYT